MKAWRGQYPVPVMAQVLEVSKARFYAWLKQPPSQRAQEDERLKVAVLAPSPASATTVARQARGQGLPTPCCFAVAAARSG
jgi:putative transposase